MGMRKFGAAGLLFIISCAASIWGLGTAFHGHIDPKVGSFRISGIAHDTWIEEGAQVRLGGLWSGVNVVSLHFTPWRPEGIPPAHLALFLCDKPLGEVLISEESKFSFRLDGTCEPQVLSITVKNPFTSVSDGRQLGAQIEAIRVGSKLGVPLVHPFAILLVAGLLFLTGLLFAASFGVLAGHFAALFLGTVLSLAHLSDATNLVFLWFVMVLVGSGYLVARRHPLSGCGRVGDRAGSWRLSGGAFASLVIVLGVAAALRFHGLDFGLPGRFHPDETPKYNAIAKMVAMSDWNPRYFLHPSLLLYTSLLCERVLEYFGVGWDFNSLTRLSGRVVSASAGTLSVLLVFLIGSRLYSRFVGLFASFLLAVFPLHVTSSRYMKEDALMLFFLLATVYIVIAAVQNRRPWQVVLAGVTAGLCFGTKYTGLLSSVVICSAPFLAANKQVLDRRYLLPVLSALALVPVFFVIATPYSVLDFDHFLRGVMSERKHMLRGHTVAIDAWSQFWMYHVRRSLWPGMTSLPFVCGFAGIGLVLWRRNREDLWILALLLLFLLPAEWVKAKPAPQPERYMIPCLPFLALLAGEFMRVLANTRVRGPVLVASLAVLILPLHETVLLSSEVANDTRERLGEWMAAELPKGSKVLVDWIPYAPLPPEGDHGIVLEMFPPGLLIHDLRAIIDGNLEPNYDYLALSSLVYDRYFTQPFSDSVRRQVIRDAFAALPVLKEEVPLYKTYGFHNPAVTIFSLRDEDRELFSKTGDNRARTSNPWPRPPRLESWLWKSLGGLGDWHA